MSIVRKVIEICGSQAELAKACEVSQQAVNKWLKGASVNGKYFQAISDATNNEITVEQLAKAFDHRNKK